MCDCGGVGVNHKAQTISLNNKQEFGFNSITSSRLLLFISASLQSLLCFISNAECNFMSRCLSWSRVSQRQLNNWRHFLCFPSLYQRWPSLVQKMLHNKLIRALCFTRRHFNWVENVNQFTWEEDRSNWKEMSIKRLARFIVSSLCHQPIQLMF